MDKTIQKVLLTVILPLLGILLFNQLSRNSIPILQDILAALPIIIVLIVMTVFHISGQYAGAIGLGCGIWVALQAYGLNWNVFWVSQLKGLCLTIYVLAVFWPALFLYHVVNSAGGIQAIAIALEQMITDRPTLLIVVAWAFSALLEGLAGFGIPVAIVSPILVSLAVDPILAVSAVAIGHAWAVTMGNMGMVYQTLISVVKVNQVFLAPNVTLLLGIACLVCGFAVANIFRAIHRWMVVLGIGTVMMLVQYLVGTSSIQPMTNFLAGLAGVSIGIILNWFLFGSGKPIHWPDWNDSLKSGVFTYGGLAVLMSLITLIRPLNLWLANYKWVVAFPAVKSNLGFITQAVNAQTYKPLLHPGTVILVVAFIAYFLNQKNKLYTNDSIKSIASTSFHSAKPAMIGVATMVGLSAVMDHSGMTIRLAEALATLFGKVFPLISPLLGMIGAFATGSNNNSNVLFGSLQENIAMILKLSPAIIVAAQTAGGSLGSMIAPAKLIVGCSTVNIRGRDGEVLRRTIPYGLGIALVMGIATFLLVMFAS
jgi:lactate permease